MSQQLTATKAKVRAYAREDRASKARILDELVELTGWHRDCARAALRDALVLKVVRARAPGHRRPALESDEISSGALRENSRLTQRCDTRFATAHKQARQPGNYVFVDIWCYTRAMTKTALVTGGTGGLGSAVTAKLLDTGWRVVVPWIIKAELERLGTHPRLELIQADLFDPQDVAEVAKLAGSNPDAPLGAVANLVGGFAMGGKIHETPIADFDRMMRLNLRPTYLTTQAALPYMIEAGGGSIVAVSTKAAFAPFAGASAYVTSKAAVWALVSALAVEYASSGIRANAILPSVIDTPGNRESQPDSSRTNWTSPADIANTIAYLFSDSSTAITGAQIPVPGVSK